MEKEFVPYELAVKLKELGFDAPCFGYKTENSILSTKLKITNSKLEKQAIKYRQTYKGILPNMVATPLWQQAFDWFREQHSLFGSAQYDHIKNALSYYIVWGRMGGYCNVEWDYLTYQEARQACLEKLIEAVIPNT